jgi:hypothetical protein
MPNYVMLFDDVKHLERLLAFIEGKEMSADVADAAKSLQYWANLQRSKHEKFVAKCRAEHPENYQA